MSAAQAIVDRRARRRAQQGGAGRRGGCRGQGRDARRAGAARALRPLERRPRATALLAIRLARQIQGRWSEDTIIAGKPHHVVWKDGVPVEAFPPVEDLELRPELRDFDERLPRSRRPSAAARAGL